MSKLTFKEFAKINRARCESDDGFCQPLTLWSKSDWVTAVTGELGEAANIVKKLNRVRDGIPGNTESADGLNASLLDELADVFIYLDLMIQSEGESLAAIVAAKFNRTSKELGFPHRVPQRSE